MTLKQKKRGGNQSYSHNLEILASVNQSSELMQGKQGGQRSKHGVVIATGIRRISLNFIKYIWHLKIYKKNKLSNSFKKYYKLYRGFSLLGEPAS